ncbi:nitrogen fixation NifU-like protein [Arthrobacter stackebrandtii]|uniref:Nitrogen fixation NifU-like protein n=1 Tax=Arthrobacter stackebrandtii TaxID=272161 RepID=A0ABS4YRV9_9MICC|nr:SUF system NifU family Fe-S cluster assembly protein [Arthrobacter stackebrandtii]MBP2411541.1 nitrogen fixation NifU-like protein [Arthrobacter stackebrandtii]PYG99225.1 SUF system NifU family Fe-S cluster assembly protein [Arthrobacter stackebrandtii]
MSELDSLYQQIILEESKTRRGGDLAPEQMSGEGLPANVGQCHQLNPVCGDEITLRIETDAGKVSGIHWAGDGCSISMASASILSDMVVGLDRGEMQVLVDNFREVMRSRGKIQADEDILGDAAALSGVSKFPARVKCAMLAWVAAEDALNQTR